MAEPLPGCQSSRPSHFKFTTQEGDDYTISEAARVESLTDRNGNTLSATRDGIFHSSGKRLTDVRDSQARIEKIIDPAGKKLFYGYNSLSSLASFTDRVTNSTAFSGVVELHSKNLNKESRW